MTVVPAAWAKSFTDVADTHVRSDLPETNYGTATHLRVDGSPVSRSYLRFKVEGLTARVKKATLWVYTKSPITRSGIDLRPVTGSWSESTTSYWNRPGIGSSVANSGSAESGRWVSIDATRLVAGDGTVNFALTTTSTTARHLAAREDAAHAPRLVVETEVPPPTDETLGPRADFEGAQSHAMWSGTLDDATRELDMLQSGGANALRVD